jgi:hypothetical protein
VRLRQKILRAAVGSPTKEEVREKSKIRFFTGGARGRLEKNYGQADPIVSCWWVNATGTSARKTKRTRQRDNERTKRQEDLADHLMMSCLSGQPYSPLYSSNSA